MRCSPSLAGLSPEYFLFVYFVCFGVTPDCIRPAPRSFSSVLIREIRGQVSPLG